MVFYRVIVVDDEDDIRSRIAGLIDSRPGFSVVGVAANGFDALELAQKLNPHIIVTDICMPFIDGLELLKQVSRDIPAIRSILISGFDEFDYAREAISLGVSAYLTKPIEPQELFDILDNIKTELESEELSQAELEKLQLVYQKSIPLLIERYINQLISGTSEQAQEALELHGISFAKPYALLAVKIKTLGMHACSLEGEKLRLLVLERIATIFDTAGFHWVSSSAQNLLVYIIDMPGDKLVSDVLDDSLALAVKLCKKFAEANISIGVSHLHKGATRLSEAFAEAERALSAEPFVDADHVIYYDDLHASRGVASKQGLSREEVQTLEHVIRTGSQDEVHKAFVALKDRRTQIDTRVLAFHLGHILFSFAHLLDIPIYSAIEGDPSLTFMDFTDTNLMIDWVEQSVMQIRSYGETQKISHVQEILEGAMSYIRNNFQNSALSLEEVAESQKVSVSYLSTLFKRRGTTFLKYLTSIRIKHAKELLSLTGYRMLQIAEQCGYNDAYYFSHSFKKYEGLSPRAYREKLNER